LRRPMPAPSRSKLMFLVVVLSMPLLTGAS